MGKIAIIFLFFFCITTLSLHAMNDSEKLKVKKFPSLKPYVSIHY